MSIVDHDGSAEFPCPRDDVFEALQQAVSTLQGMEVASAERLTGRVVVKTGMSLRSWGENVPISVTEIAPGRTRVSITSTPKTGVLFGGLFDLGKNRGNIEKIFTATATTQAAPAASPVPAKPPISSLAPAPAQDDHAATSAANEIAKLADLHAKGILTDDEFAAFKAKLME